MGEMTDGYDTYSTGEITWSPRGRLSRQPRQVVTSGGVGSAELLRFIQDNAHLARGTLGDAASAKPPLRDRLRAERDALEEALDVIAQRLARKNDQLAQLARWPEEDPFENGDRLEFTKVFPNSDRVYTYLALKADGLFHVTGARSPQGVTWAEFVEWCGLGVDSVWKIGGKGGRRKVVG